MRVSWLWSHSWEDSCSASQETVHLSWKRKYIAMCIRTHHWPLYPESNEAILLPDILFILNSNFVLLLLLLCLCLGVLCGLFSSDFQNVILYEHFSFLIHDLCYHTIIRGGWDWVHLVLRPLFGLLYQPQMIDDYDCGAIRGMRIGKVNRSTLRKPASVELCPPEIPMSWPGLEPGPQRWESDD
jgi:hypothetical protein